MSTRARSATTRARRARRERGARCIRRPRARVGGRDARGTTTRAGELRRRLGSRDADAPRSPAARARGRAPARRRARDGADARDEATRSGDWVYERVDRARRAGARGGRAARARARTARSLTRGTKPWGRRDAPGRAGTTARRRREDRIGRRKGGRRTRSRGSRIADDERSGRAVRTGD